MKRAMRKTIFIAGVAICIICAALISYGFMEFTQRDATSSQDLTLSDYPKLFAKEAVIVIGEQTFNKSLTKNAAQASQIEKESAEAIAANIKNLTGYKPKIYISKKIESFKYSYNLIIVGTPKSNKVIREVYNMTDAIRVTDEYPGENKGILEILENPWNEKRAMLLVEGSDEWGVKAGVKTIIDMDRRIQDNTLIVDWVEESSEVIVEVSKSIKLKALKAYNLSDSKISIPKDLYIDSYHPETEGYYIVQFKGPIYEEYKAQVIDLGGKFFDYIPENAFIVKMNVSTRDKVQKLNVIQWVGIYQPAYKISPSLLNKLGNVTLTVGIFGGENMTNISHKIESMDGIISVASDNKIRVLLNVSIISKIANISGIKYIEEYVMPQLPPKEVFPGGGPK